MKKNGEDLITWGSVYVERANFTRLALGFIEPYVCNQTLVGKRLMRFISSMLLTRPYFCKNAETGARAAQALIDIRFGVIALWFYDPVLLAKLFCGSYAKERVGALGCKFTLRL